MKGARILKNERWKKERNEETKMKKENGSHLARYNKEDSTVDVYKPGDREYRKGKESKDSLRGLRCSRSG